MGSGTLSLIISTGDYENEKCALCRLPPSPPRIQRRNFSNASIVGNSRTRPYYLRRCKRTPPTNIGSLPNELLLDILARVPADDLLERTMFVCRSWCQIIRYYDFVNAQVRHSTYGLLICHRNPIFVSATTQGRIETRELRYLCKSMYFTTANTGLALDICPKTNILHIKNVATRQRMALPPKPGTCAGKCGIGCAAAAASMEYKVAVPFSDRNSLFGYRISILTVGVDKSWRNVEAQYLPKSVHYTFFCYSLSSEGFIHWICSSKKKAEVVTLDVETEIVTWSEIPLPLLQDSPHGSTFVSTGRLLMLLVSRRYLSWEVWGKGSRNGEWSKVLPDIELAGEKSRLEQFAVEDGALKLKKLQPLGWVKYPEVLAFHFYQTCIFYNLDTHGIIDTLQLDDPGRHFTGHVHKNNLIWPWLS